MRTGKPLPVAAYLPREFTKKKLETAFKPLKEEIERNPKPGNAQAELFMIEFFSRLSDSFRRAAGQRR